MSEWSITKKQGRTPPTLTPETLRELPDAFDIPATAGDYIRAHADAWEKQVEKLELRVSGLERALEHNINIIHSLRKRKTK